MIYDRFTCPEPSLNPPEAQYPRCPVCGEECDTLYSNADGEIVGCGECLTQIDAWEWQP